GREGGSSLEYQGQAGGRVNFFRAHGDPGRTEDPGYAEVFFGEFPYSRVPACFAQRLPTRSAEWPLPLRSSNAISPGDGRLLLPPGPGIANQPSSSQSWDRRLSGADRDRDGPVRLSETWAPLRMKRTPVSLNERSLAHAATPMSTRPKTEPSYLQAVASEGSLIRLVHASRAASGYP